MSAMQIIEKMRSIFETVGASVEVQEEILKGLIYRSVCSEVGLPNAGERENRHGLRALLIGELRLLMKLMTPGEAVVCINDDNGFQMDDSYLEFAKKEFGIEIDNRLEIISVPSASKLFTFMSAPISLLIFAFNVFRYFVRKPSFIFVPHVKGFLFRESLLSGTRTVLGFLVRKNVKYIFTRPYFSFQAMTWIAFLKRQGIPVIEIGHGLINNKHPFYLDFGNCSFEIGRLLPDYFIVRNPREREYIEDHLGVKAAVYEKEKKISVKRYRQIRSSLNLGEDENIGLFSLQDMYLEESYFDILAKVLKSNIASFWILAEHPLHLTQKSTVRQELSSEGIENFVFTSDIGISTSEALAVCDLHASHSSSVLYEAAESLKTNFVCSSYGAELVADLLLDGGAVSFDNRN